MKGIVMKPAFTAAILCFALAACNDHSSSTSDQQTFSGNSDDSDAIKAPLREEVDPSIQSLWQRLENQDTAEETFQEIVTEIRKEVFHEEYRKAYRYSFGGVRFLQGRECGKAAVALLKGKGAPCGTGLRPGGVSAPDDLPFVEGMQGVLFLNRSGVPEWQIDKE
ncbi:MAG: hypothetical protein ACYTHN_21660, partial [Planctomycetota bacterium]